MEFLDRIYGCLVGVAVGDAMGMPSYFTYQENLQKLGKITEFLDAPNDHPIHRGFVAGQVTDDTQQTLCILDSLLAEGRLTSEGVARSLIKWYTEMGGSSMEYIGPTSSHAIRALIEGKNLEEAGKYGYTNGAAMRICPVGFLHPGDLKETVDEVEKACLPTHNTNIAISGASAIACAVSACASASPDPDQVVDAAITGARLGKNRGLKFLGPSIEKRIELALQIIKKTKSRAKAYQEIYQLFGAGLPIYDVVPVAIAIFYGEKGDPVPAVLIAANYGGDADTVGAMVGGICGAFSGIEAFPRQYIEKIERVNNLGLEVYARKLARLVQKEGK
jgi:ADP-ribosylglycohydrolase